MRQTLVLIPAREVVGVVVGNKKTSSRKQESTVRVQGLQSATKSRERVGIDPAQKCGLIHQCIQARPDNKQYEAFAYGCSIV